MCAQQDTLFHAVNIPIVHKKLFIMSEEHNIAEFKDIQYLVIEQLIFQNPSIKNFQLLLETSPAMQYYLEKLLLEDDRDSLLLEHDFFKFSEFHQHLAIISPKIERCSKNCLPKQIFFTSLK